MAKHLNINSMLLEADSSKKEKVSIQSRELGLDRDAALSLYNLYRLYKKIVHISKEYEDLINKLDTDGVLYKFVANITNKLNVDIRNKQIEILNKRNHKIIDLVYRGPVTKTTFDINMWLDKCKEIYGIEEDLIKKMKEYYLFVTDSKNKEEYRSVRQVGDTSDPYFSMNPGSLKIPKINTSVKLDNDKVNQLFKNLNEELSYETYSLYKEIMDLLDRYERALDQLDAIITPVLSGDVQMAAESKMPTLKSIVEHYLKK